MIMNLIRLFTLTAAFALTTHAWAGGSKKCDPEILKKYDTNGDGNLGKSEKVAMKKDIEASHAAKDLEKYDLNKDGKLDDAEKAAIQKDVEAHKAEAKAKREKMMKKYDVNHDGKLDDAEKAAMKENAKKK